MCSTSWASSRSPGGLVDFIARFEQHVISAAQRYPRRLWSDLDARTADDRRIAVDRSAAGGLWSSGHIRCRLRYGHRPFAEAPGVIEPVSEFFRAVPAPVLVPVLMLLLGIGTTMKVFVIAFGSFWPVLLNTTEGVRALDSALRDVAQTYHFRRGTFLTAVVLRGASPQIMAGARQALSLAVILMVISEMFAANNGLGSRSSIPTKLCDSRDVDRYSASRRAGHGAVRDVPLRRGARAQLVR